MLPRRPSDSSPAASINDPRIRLPASTGPPDDSEPARPKVWLIFGATGHIGRSLVKAALNHGDKVTAVGRVTENTRQQMQGWHEDCVGDLCDVRIRESVETVIRASAAHWGRIDIIVK
jgi:NAD(P)-dependent dehydrogenase (short-subunit alcohol dehydrogenase family)